MTTKRKNAPLEASNVAVLLEHIPIGATRSIHSLQVKRVEADHYSVEGGPVIDLVDAMAQIGSYSGKHSNPRSTATTIKDATRKAAVVARTKYDKAAEAVDDNIEAEQHYNEAEIVLAEEGDADTAVAYLVKAFDILDALDTPYRKGARIDRKKYANQSLKFAVIRMLRKLLTTGYSGHTASPAVRQKYAHWVPDLEKDEQELEQALYGQAHNPLSIDPHWQASIPYVKENGDMLYYWHWKGGGWNSEWAKSREEAIAKGNAMGSVQPGGIRMKALEVDEKSVVAGKAAERATFSHPLGLGPGSLAWAQANRPEAVIDLPERPAGAYFGESKAKKVFPKPKAKARKVVPKKKTKTSNPAAKFERGKPVGGGHREERGYFYEVLNAAGKPVALTTNKAEAEEVCNDPKAIGLPKGEYTLRHVGGKGSVPAIKGTRARKV